MLLSPLSSVLPVWIISLFWSLSISSSTCSGKVVVSKDEIFAPANSSGCSWCSRSLTFSKRQLHHVPFQNQCRETFHKLSFSRKCSKLRSCYLSLIWGVSRGCGTEQELTLVQMCFVAGLFHIQCCILKITITYRYRHLICSILQNGPENKISSEEQGSGREQN